MDKLLSLCMIVRDEEKVLKRCLDSVKGLVDEIIIVDTGSVDGTKEIARSYTDHIYDFEWIQDFAAAKNEAIRKATGKWILVLDADEYAIDEGQEKLRGYLESLDHQQPVGLILPIYNYTGSLSSGNFVESTAVRIFNNLPSVYFERPIHEQVVLQGGELPVVHYKFTLFHTGYTLETQTEKKKTERNLAIFEKLKEKQTLQEYDYFTLGNEYNTLRDYKKALYYYKRAITKKSYNQAFIPHCMTNMTAILIDTDQLREALEVIETGLQRWPHYADFHCLRGAAYEKAGFGHLAEAQFLKCLEIADSPASKKGIYWLVAPKYGSTVPLTRLCRLSFANMDWNKTVYYLTKLLHLDPTDHLILYQLLNILQQSEDARSIISFLDKIYPEQTQVEAKKLLNVCLLLGNRELSEYYCSKCTELHVPLQSYYKLYLALVQNDPSGFEQALSDPTLSQHKDQANKLLFLAAIVWNKPEYIHRLEASEASLQEAEAYKAVLQYLFGQNNLQQSDYDIQLAATTLMDLFKMGYYEAYDWVINKFPDQFHELANLLGNQFIERSQIQLALDYYSLLLKDGKLSGEGYEHLARLYLNDGETEEGLEFLLQAIMANPHNPQNYPLYLLNCKDPEHYGEVLALYKKELPNYWALGLLG